MTRKQRILARHALGLPNSQRRSYRNRFLAAYAPGAYDDWQRLVDAGMAEMGPEVKYRAKGAAGGHTHQWFYLTRAGAEAVLEDGERLCREDFPDAAQEVG